MTLAQRSLPALALALGLTTFAYGAVIGVLLQVQGALATNLFPASGDAIGAHAATMVFSYLILIAMGLIEWRLMGLTPRSRGGLVQVGALFGGGLILAVTLLFLDQSVVQAVGGIYLLVELVAVGFFARRVLPHALRSDWRSGAPGRHVAMAAVFVIIATAIFLYVVFLFISTGDPNKIPTGVLVASDHAAFIGVMTNLIFGLALGLAADRRDRWPWAGQVVFWAVNLGLVVFLLGLIAVSPELKRIGSPIMGIGILVGLATIALRLWSSDLSAARRTPGADRRVVEQFGRGAAAASACRGPRSMTRERLGGASDFGAPSHQLEEGVGAKSWPPSSSPQWPRRITSRSTHPIGIGANHWAIRNSVTAAVTWSVIPDPATLDRMPM